MEHQPPLVQRLWKFMSTLSVNITDKLHVVSSFEDDIALEQKEVFALLLIHPSPTDLNRAINLFENGYIHHLGLVHTLEDRYKHWNLLNCFTMGVDDDSNCVTYTGPNVHEFINSIQQLSSVFVKL